MAQISKRHISEEKLKKILKLLFGLITRLPTKEEVELILNELLTETERIMLAKRLACFFLLLKGVPNEAVADSIKVSTSTVNFYKKYLHYSHKIKEYLEGKLAEEKFKNFFEDIFVELFYGLPRKGSDWGENLRQYHAHKRRRNKPF